MDFQYFGRKNEEPAQDGPGEDAPVEAASASEQAEHADDSGVIALHDDVPAPAEAPVDSEPETPEASPSEKPAEPAPAPVSEPQPETPAPIEEPVPAPSSDMAAPTGDTYGDFYRLAPEQFDSMTVKDFFELADRYGALGADIHRIEAVIEHHQQLIDQLESAESRRDASIVDKVEHYNYGVEGEAEGDTAFTLGRLVREVRRGRQGILKATATDKQKAVIDQLSRLGDSFAVSPQEKIAGYRRLLQDYWLTESRDVLGRRKAALDTFAGQYITHGEADISHDDQPAEG